MRWGHLIGVAFAFLFLAGAAQAAPREDVLAGAIRCGSIGNSRTWLDCYYGAAQPMRTQLGLAPALPAQVRLAAAPPAGTPADNTLRQDILSAAIRCSGEGRQWLDCYYGSAQPMRAQLGLSPALQARQAAPPPPVRTASLPPSPAPGAYTPPPGYVLQRAAPPKNAEFPSFWSGLFGEDPVVVKTQLASYGLDSDGYFTATLANGQVWRQTSGATNAHWPRAPSTYQVEISKGMMRTYNFRVAGDPNLYKVRRVR
ncbi:MAG TPA: hypothetical protein VHV26_15725 [Rhizomicrobium sp.]|jgi:hypothetical protein|nr:hypothetical protein [Rhizomicrobium sp.]